jgi:phage shock protein A
MEVGVEHLLIAEVDFMIARALQRAQQHESHVGSRGDARQQSQRALKNVQRSLERLRRYRQALATERAPGPTRSETRRGRAPPQPRGRCL